MKGTFPVSEIFDKNNLKQKLMAITYHTLDWKLTHVFTKKIGPNCLIHHGLSMNSGKPQSQGDLR